MSGFHYRYSLCREGESKTRFHQVLHHMEGPVGSPEGRGLPWVGHSQQASPNNLKRAATDASDVRMVVLEDQDPKGQELILRDEAALGTTRGILIMMKFGISTSTWFQVIPLCSRILAEFYNIIK